jgi:glucan phosphoethanolaminetransferase (alkaline phosphatase superfamily)
MRNHRELRLMLVPSNVVSAIHGYTRRQLAVPTELKTIGADARREEATAGVRKPRLTVLMVGETARSANFSSMAIPGYQSGIGQAWCLKFYQCQLMWNSYGRFLTLHVPGCG